jgi:hypothetical protein
MLLALLVALFETSSIYLAALVQAILVSFGAIIAALLPCLITFSLAFF